MPKVSQSYLDGRRAEILEAAIECFSREGFHRATMRDIVKQSRLSPGAIYNYFGSKEEIIEAISAQRHATEQELFSEASEGATVSDVLMRVRDTFFGGLNNPKERRRRRVIIQLWAEAQRNPKILKLVRHAVDEPCRLLSAILTDAQKRGQISNSVNPDAMGRFLVAAFHGIVLQVEWNDPLDIEPFLLLLDDFLGCVTLSSGSGAGNRR